MNKALLKYFKPVKKYAVLAIILILLETFLETLVPYMYAQIVDVGIVNNDVPFILLWGGLMILSSFFAFLTGIYSVKFVALTGQGYGAELRKVQYQKIQSFTQETKDQFPVSSLISRLTSDTYTIQNAVITGMRGLFRAPFMITMVLVLSFELNAQIAVVFAVVLPIVALFMLIVVFRVKPIFTYLQKRFDTLNRTLQENFQAIRVVKSYVTKDYEIEKFEKINREYYNVARKAFQTVSLNNPMMQLGLYASLIGLLIVGGPLIRDKISSVGEITGLLTYVLQLLNALLMLAQLLIMFSRTIASGTRIKEVLDAKNIMEVVTISEHKISEANLSFRDVSFKYSREDDAPFVLENISFDLNKGETLGIIGQTGSGKSTLASLITRLYEVSKGEIYIDNQRINTYSQSDIFTNINIVFQANMLFSGTIADNLAWGSENATEEEIYRALKASLSDEIIAKLPLGINSEVGQAGVNLSGGQKQRIALARALLRKPKILILDDSLSAIDTINEAKIRKNLKKFYPEITLINISQRISAIKDSTTILLMHEGKINGRGSHAELIESNEIYRDIYETQLKGAKA